MQAGRNGFFYVLERGTGKLVAANKYVKVTWADRYRHGEWATGLERDDEADRRMDPPQS